MHLILKYWKWLAIAAIVFFPTLIFLLTGKDPKASILDDVLESPTINSATAKSRAEQLLNAMNRNGTEEEIIYTLLTGINLADFKLIYEHFGFVSYDKILGTESFSLLNPKVDIITWIVNELTPTELERLKSLNPVLPL